MALFFKNFFFKITMPSFKLCLVDPRGPLKIIRGPLLGCVPKVENYWYSIYVSSHIIVVMYV